MSGETDRQIEPYIRLRCNGAHSFLLSMQHPFSQPLPGCDTLEQAEGNHFLDAMQMELRERRIRDYGRASVTGYKEVELHFDELKKSDADVYVTCLYAKSRLAAVFSDLSDGQLRNALEGESLAIVSKLYGDHEVIRPAVTAYLCQQPRKVDPEVCQRIRTRIEKLLPTMLAIVAEHSQQERKAIPREHIANNVWKSGVAAKERLPVPMAQAALRLRTLIYLRHPIDLIREIAHWISNTESSE